MTSIWIKNKSLVRIVIHPTENLLAVAGKRSSLVLQYDENTIEVMQHHLDEDKQESLICATFFDMKNTVYLATAGHLGIVKVINISEYCFSGFLRGHGGSITDIKAHTKDEKVLFSASEDTTVRMWDFEAKRCLAIFGGYIGHRDYVLSIDVSACGEKVVSSGTDCTIKVWKIPSVGEDEIASVYFPEYSSSKIHKSYITCVRFYGELLVSTSFGGRIVIVSPYFLTEVYSHFLSSDSLFIDEYRLKKGSQFTNTFSLDRDRLLACVKGGSRQALLFDLKQLSKGFFPIAVDFTKQKVVQDAVIRGNNIFVLYDGFKVEKVNLDS